MTEYEQWLVALGLTVGGAVAACRYQEPALRGLFAGRRATGRFCVRHARVVYVVVSAAAFVGLAGPPRAAGDPWAAAVRQVTAGLVGIVLAAFAVGGVGFVASRRRTVPVWVESGRVDDLLRALEQIREYRVGEMFRERSDGGPPVAPMAVPPVAANDLKRLVRRMRVIRAREVLTRAAEPPT